MKRPDHVYDTHITFMDNLFLMGWRRMQDARKDIEVYFRITPEESQELVAYWAHTLKERQGKDGKGIQNKSD